MVLIEKVAARVPGLWTAEAAGVLVSSRRILERLAPMGPEGKPVSVDFIERHLGIKTVALTRKTFDSIESEIRPPRGNGVNETLLDLVGQCLDEVLPEVAERAKVRRHLHLGLTPPGDMDFYLGKVRRQYGLPEYLPTEYVTHACPALPTVLASLNQIPVSEEMLCLVTADQNMLPFLNQYEQLSEEHCRDINQWLYVSAFGEAAGAALIRVCPDNHEARRRRGWEVVSASVSSVPGVGENTWRGIINTKGVLEIDVKNVLPTYKAAMKKQVATALDAISNCIPSQTSASERRLAAIDSLHAYCFHESNLFLLSEMAQEYSIPLDLIPSNCDRTGSLVGMSLFLTLSQALRSWDKLNMSGERPKNFIAGSVVGQSGVAIGCGHIVLRALDEKKEAAFFELTESHVRSALSPLSQSGDMKTFLAQSARLDIDWKIMGHTAPVCGSYDSKTLQAKWDSLMEVLDPPRLPLKIENVIVDAKKQTAIVEMHAEAIRTVGGKYEQSYCWILKFDNEGLITSIRAYLDTAMATRTLAR